MRHIVRLRLVFRSCQSLAGARRPNEHALLTTPGCAGNTDIYNCRYQVVRNECKRYQSSSSSSATGNIYRSPKSDEHLPELSLGEYMFSKTNQFGSKIALVDNANGKTYTYSQLEDYSKRVGSYLTRKGLKKGDVVCYFGTNNPEFCLLLLGCASVGVILTTANPAYTSDELRRHMDHSGAKAIFTVPALVDRAKEAGCKDITVVGEAEGCRPFDEVLKDDGKAFPEHVKINPKEDVVILPYSSGTTGLPKGVMLTHHNVVANLMQFRKTLISTADDNNYAVLPFYHIYGMAPLLLGTLQEGGTLVTTPGFEPESFLNTLINQKISQIHIVPSILLFLARHPIVDKYDLSRIRTVLSAAAPLGEGLTYEFMEKRKLDVKQGYGMTETAPVVAIDEEPITVGSIGALICNTEAKFVDPESGKSLERKQVGELCVRGPQNMKGYFNNEKATQDMIDKDGWLHTGDIGYMLDNDCLVITDRLKELIKYKGLQVAPAELEDVLHKHPAVQDVAVIGVPDERAGEIPRAFVVCRPGREVSENDIAQYVEQNVSDYKKLRGGVKFLKEIPKSPSGKILRRVLRDDA